MQQTLTKVSLAVQTIVMLQGCSSDQSAATQGSEDVSG